MINNGKIVSWFYIVLILGCVGYIVKEKLDYINELEQAVIEQDRAIKMLRLERELINIRHQITPGTLDLPIYQ